MGDSCIDARLSLETSNDTANDLGETLDQETQTDDALVALIKNGDTAAFAQLMQRHHRFCMSKAYSILRNRADAEDEVQNAWVQVWTHLDSYKGQGPFFGWLIRIVSNQCLMRLRKAKLAPMTSVDEVFESDDSFRLEVIDQRELPEQMAGYEEAWKLVNTEIQRVPPLLRDILVMRGLRHRLMQDISSDLGITVPAAKSRLTRARAELKKRMEKHYGEGVRGSLRLTPAPSHAVKANLAVR
jgi:RNA polymerase sigma-70 factor (ECF subfamily)